MRKLYYLERSLIRPTSTLASLMATATRSRMRFRDAHICITDMEEDGVLCQPELNLLMDVMLTYLDENSQVLCVPNYGTLAVYGQVAGCKDPTELRCLVADLGDGPCRVSQAGALEYASSRDEVDSAVQAVLNYDAKVDTPAFLCDAELEDGELKSRIYFDKENNGVRGADCRVALVLNSDVGRFVASFCCSGSMGSIEPLAVVAQTLACLQMDDVRLQESIEVVRRQMAEENGRYVRVMDAVARTFADGTDPLLKPWQDWLQETNP